MAEPLDPRLLARLREPLSWPTPQRYVPSTPVLKAKPRRPKRKTFLLPREMRAALDIVSREWGVDAESILTGGRTRCFSRPRAAVAWLSWTPDKGGILGLSLPQIGRGLSIHHTSVLYAARVAMRLREGDGEFREHYERAHAALLAMCEAMPVAPVTKYRLLTTEA